MKIVKITTAVQSLPLTTPFTTAQHTVTAAEALQVSLLTDTGAIGVGSGTPNTVVTGDTIASMQALIKDAFTPALVGCELADFNQILSIVHGIVRGAGPTKAAIELALYDLRAQASGMDLCGLLGGKPQAVCTDLTISIQSAPKMLEAAKTAVTQGFTALKIKVGAQPLAEDLTLIRQLADIVGPSGELRLDANQGWSRSTAAHALRVLAAENLPIAFVEQPVAAADLEGLRALHDLQLLPIMADESVHTYQDALRVLAMQAADMINIKLMKTGGLQAAIRINDACAASGVPCMIGSMIEPATSIVAAVAFAATHSNVRYADLDAVYMVKTAQPELMFSGPQLRLGAAHV